MEAATHDERDPLGDAHPGSLLGAVSGMEQGKAHPQGVGAIEGDDSVAPQREFARAVGAREARPVGHESREVPGTKLGAQMLLVLDAVHEGLGGSLGEAPEGERLPGDLREFAGQQVRGPLPENAAARRREADFHPGFDEAQTGLVTRDPDRGAFERLLAARIDADLPAVTRSGGTPRTGNRPAELAAQKVGESNPPDPVREEIGGKTRYRPVHPDPDARGRGEGVARHPVHEHRDPVPDGPFPFEVPVGRVAASVEAAAGGGEIGSAANSAAVPSATG